MPPGKIFNPIRDLFAYSNEIFKISELDWANFDVDRPYLILFTPRSGSTLLGRLIGRTELSNFPDEFFNEKFLRSQIGGMSPEFRQYFEPLIQRNNKNGTWGVEIDARRYHWLLDLMDLDDALRSDAGIPVIWLTRQDIVSQAYSLAKARLSRKWHVYADGPFQKFAKMMRRLRFFPLSKNGEANLMVEPREKSFREIPSSVDDKAIWAQVFYILKWEQEIERKFCQNNFNPLRITYEQLICDQAITLVRTFAHLGFDEADIHIGVAKACSTNNPTIKMHYPDKIHQLTSFYTRYAKIIDAIQANRTDISEETIKTLISVSNEGTNHVK